MGRSDATHARDMGEYYDREFEVERPQVLSNRAGLPLLDLATQKPVGDNTLTGLLTGAFAVSDLANVFGGIADGTYGVIVDGVDEARSKTTEKAFEAFLDDIAKLCGPSPTWLWLEGTMLRNTDPSPYTSD